MLPVHRTHFEALIQGALDVFGGQTKLGKCLLYHTNLRTAISEETLCGG